MTLGDIFAGIAVVITVPIAYIVFGISFMAVMILGIWLTFVAGFGALIGIMSFFKWLATLI